MADPVDQILDEIEKPEVKPEVSPEKAELDRVKAELERLQSDPVISQLRENPNLLHDLRAQQIQQSTTPPQTTDSGGDEFWTDPAKATQKAAEKIIQDRVLPMAQQMGASVVGLYIQQFKGTKQSSPFYHVVAPEFDKEIAPLRGGLAGYTDEQMQRLFNTVWNAKVGEYVNKRQAERPKEQPVNLGGGGAAGGGGPKQKRSLAEIDPKAYAIAVGAGMSDEDMQKLADEIEGE